MTAKEGRRVLLIACEGHQAAPGGHIGKHVRIIGQIAICEASGRDFAFWVKDLLIVIFVDVAPKRLRVADEDRFGKFRQHRVQPVVAAIVGLMLDVQQNRHAVFSGQFIQFLALRRIALHVEFLLRDHARALFQPVFDFSGRGVEIGDLVAGPQIGSGMRFREILRPGRAHTLRGESVRLSIVRRRPRNHRSRRQNDRRRHSHRLLMRQQVRIRAQVIIHVLVDIDHRLFVIGENGAAGTGERGGEEMAAVHGNRFSVRSSQFPVDGAHEAHETHTAHASVFYEPNRSLNLRIQFHTRPASQTAAVEIDRALCHDVDHRGLQRARGHVGNGHAGPHHG